MTCGKFDVNDPKERADWRKACHDHSIAEPPPVLENYIVALIDRDAAAREVLALLVERIEIDSTYAGLTLSPAYARAADVVAKDKARGG